MTYAASEGSIEDGEPYELFLFRSRFSGLFLMSNQPTGLVSKSPLFGRPLFGRTIYRDTWAASGIRRTEGVVGTADDEMKLTLAADDDLAVFLLANAFYDPVDLDIYRGHVNDPTETWVLQYRGNVINTDLVGREVEITCMSFLAQLGQTAAGRSYTRNCDWQHYGTECGLNRADWEFDGTITARAGVFVTVPEAAARPEGDLIAGGLRIGDQIVIIRSHIGDQLELSFLPPALLAATLPLVVRVSPGCNRTSDRCATFANSLNYGGHENMPTQNVFNGLRLYTAWRT